MGRTGRQLLGGYKKNLIAIGHCYESAQKRVKTEHECVILLRIYAKNHSFL